MKSPIAYVVECPRCGDVGGIPLTQAGKFWLADVRWKCPSCGQTVDRDKMIEKD